MQVKNELYERPNKPAILADGTKMLERWTNEGVEITRVVIRHASGAGSRPCELVITVEEGDVLDDVFDEALYCTSWWLGQHGVPEHQMVYWAYHSNNSLKIQYTVTAQLPEGFAEPDDEDEEGDVDAEIVNPYAEQAKMWRMFAEEQRLARADERAQGLEYQRLMTGQLLETLKEERGARTQLMDQVLRLVENNDRMNKQSLEAMGALREERKLTREMTIEAYQLLHDNLKRQFDVEQAKAESAAKTQRIGMLADSLKTGAAVGVEGVGLYLAKNDPAKLSMLMSAGQAVSQLGPGQAGAPGPAPGPAPVGAAPQGLQEPPPRQPPVEPVAPQVPQIIALANLFTQSFGRVLPLFEDVLTAGQRKAFAEVSMALAVSEPDPDAVAIAVQRLHQKLQHPDRLGALIKAIPEKLPEQVASAVGQITIALLGEMETRIQEMKERIESAGSSDDE